MPNKHLNDPQAIYSYDTHEGIHHVVHISTFKIWHQIIFSILYKPLD